MQITYRQIIISTIEIMELYYRKYLKCIYALREVYTEKRKREVLCENEGFVSVCFKNLWVKYAWLICTKIYQ